MRKCTYIIGGKSFDYIELVLKFYDTESKDHALDFVYKLANSKLEIIKTKLLELKEEYAPRVDRNDFIGVEMSYDVPNSFSTLEFIDSVYFKDLAGNRIVPQIDRVNFIKYLTDEYKSSLGEDLARNLAELTVSNWDKIGKDSILLHEILTKGFDSLSNARVLLKGTAFEDAYDKVFDLIKEGSNIYTKPKGVYSNITRNKKIVKNINFKTNLLGLDESIIGHIDNIIIDSSGTLHIVNYKVVTSKLNKEKLDKYKYLLALLKLMLASKGFNVKHMTLSIIPIRVLYNDDFSKVTDIIPMDKIEYTIDNGNYVFTKYDNVAKRWILSVAEITPVSSEKLKKADKALKALWPDRTVTTQGIQQTAKEWIKTNWKTSIARVEGKPGVYYSINFSKDDTVEITDPEIPTKNTLILQLVERRILDLTFGDLYLGGHGILTQVMVGYKDGYSHFSGERRYDRCGRFLDSIFQPYLHTIKRGDKKEYDWKPIENDLLTDRNILMFQNTITKQIDVITISPFNLDSISKFRGGYTNILGLYIGDNEAMRRGNIPEGNYGNIEAIRTMFLINEVLSDIEGEYTLGKLQVISTENTSSSKVYSFENISKDFSTVLSVVKAENNDIDVTNNFIGKSYQDPANTFLQLLEDALKTGDFTDNDRINLLDWGLRAYEEADSVETKIVALEKLLSAILNEWGFTSPSEVELVAARGLKESILALIYRAVSDAYLSALGILNNIDLNEKDMTTLSSYAYSSANIPSANARLITGLYSRAADKIAENCVRDVRPVQNYITEFYDSIGRSNFQNSTIGLLTRAFRNLYEEVEGKRTMRFKNPYTDPTLSPAEAKLLKLALFTFAKFRSEMFPTLKFGFSSYTDPKLEEFAKDPLNSWYLEVPLTKANLASRRATGYNFKEWKSRILSLANNPKENFETLLENINTEEERKQIEEDLRRLSITNRFAIYDSQGPNPNIRASVLNREDPDFFETNLETLLVNFIESFHEAQEMRTMLLLSRAILLTLNSVGDPGHPRMKKTIEYINKYLTINAFKKSIMEEDTKKIIGAVIPARNLASTIYILANVTAAVRDLTEGFTLNLMRTIIKYLTDINGVDLAKAYDIVVKKSFATNVRTINLINQLNIKYRISNVDVARIQEVLATGRAGLDNWENWAYATLRRPDYVNRMTLFVAKMIHDGVWDAMSIDENGELKYDWRKDKRFSEYAKGESNKNHPKYLKQKGLYISCILEYNREHPESAINPTDPNAALPTPYTNAQIESIKAVSNSIYGSYDKSTKALYENIAIGMLLGLFTTWMNGMIGNYFRKPGSHTGELIEVQSRNAAGELEFLDEYCNILVLKTREDGSVYYLNESTGQEYDGQVMPLFKHIPVHGQGIVYSIINLCKKVFPVGYKLGGFTGVWEEIKKEILTNPLEAKNFRKLFSDLFICIFISLLYKLVFDPEYKEHKANRDNKNLLANMMEDVLYNGTANSWEGYKGALNIFTTFGENMNPPAYKASVKLMTDVTKTVFGDKTVGQLVTLNVPVFRNFRIAYELYAK